MHNARSSTSCVIATLAAVALVLGLGMIAMSALHLAVASAMRADDAPAIALPDGTTIDPVDADAQVDAPCASHPAKHPAVSHVHSRVRVPIAGISSTHQTLAVPRAEWFLPIDQIVANDASGRAPPYFFRLA